jgi:hypothetical protein
LSGPLCGVGLDGSSDQRDQDQSIKTPEPCQDQAEVVAGCREDQVDRVAVLAGEVITLEDAF